MKRNKISFFNTLEHLYLINKNYLIKNKTVKLTLLSSLVPFILIAILYTSFFTKLSLNSFQQNPNYTEQLILEKDLLDLKKIEVVEKTTFLENTKTCEEAKKLKLIDYKESITLKLNEINKVHNYLELNTIQSVPGSNKIVALLKVNEHNIKKEALLLYLISKNFYLDAYNKKRAKIYFQTNLKECLNEKINL